MAPGDMMLIDHLKELRNRFLRVVVITIAIMIFCTVFGVQIVTFSGYTFYFIVPTVYNNIASQVTLFLSENLIPAGVNLIQTAPGQSLYAQLYVAVLISVSAAIPLIVREIVAFVSPALTTTSKNKSLISAILPVFVLFVCGILFSFYLAIPITLTFLYQYGQSLGVLTFLNISDFINFVLQFFIAFGISFQLPLIMFIISFAGLVGLDFWLRNFKYALLIIIIFGAVITPDGSGITMWFISGPMLLLYMLGILSIKFKNRSDSN